ncbi:ABC transporter permease [Rhabdochromatium marinum]|uniref:ABC transporter permease n=1 Tax=Rhabdochromatium marinum TaxID=48729 RepID=UPI001904C6EF|nr:ABC transporter permease [Rhabdochromatium marinum]MBK1648026.1 ABC transporter permease [Rhabdochromatium marinum]
MSALRHEALDELRAGLRSGVVGLIYVVLVGYLLMVLTSSDYLRDMGAVDIPRNAPSLVYLMTSGDAFFLFFAWAWVFAQPIVRDHSARLSEVVFAAPISLSGWLTARFLGALGVALLLGSSQIVGFLVAPVLEWLGAVPPGSMGPTPWGPLLWAWLVFTLPLAVGAGALYTIAAIRTRGLVGPFTVAAGLMTFWMVGMIVLKGAEVSPWLATLVDPSGFAEAEHQVEHWTPQEKSTALLAPTPRLILSRLLWCLVPLALLWLTFRRTTREALVVEPAARDPGSRTARPSRTAARWVAEPVTAPSWWSALRDEALWQLRQVLLRPRLWAALAFLTVLAMVGAFYHVVQHAEGPLVPRPERVAPMLTEMFFLIITFAVAGLVGITARRDHQIGLGEMFDATPAPAFVRLLGRLVAVFALTLILALLPGIGALLTTALIAPASLNLTIPLGYQLLVLAPALLELAAVTVLLHALIRAPGPAYAASVLAAFVMVVNYETNLISYPPLQIGIPVHITLSGLTGFSPWLEQVVLSGAFKGALVILLLALAAAVTPRGTETGWSMTWPLFRQRIRGTAGVVAGGAMLVLLLLSVVLHQGYRVKGSLEPLAVSLAKDARWEQHWLAAPAPFSVTGGNLVLRLDLGARSLEGHWTITGVQADGGLLHAELPNGFSLHSARVQGQPTPAIVEDDHLALQLGACPTNGCTVELAWSQVQSGWNAEARPAWLLHDSYWLHASEVLPQLGLDPKRVLRVPADRAEQGLRPRIALPEDRAAVSIDAAAPAGRWHWRVELVDAGEERGSGGLIEGPFDFAAAWQLDAQRSVHGETVFIHDATRTITAAQIAADLVAMRACIARRLGAAPAVSEVFQWPRGLEESTLAGDRLLLAEDPHWDVTDTGVGRWLRRATIASALARRQVRDATDLHQGSGSLWFSHSIPGALGLLCVADSDGIDAFAAVMEREADTVTQALAASAVPVGALLSARTDDWAGDYAPLAALDWTARQTPASFTALFAEIRNSQKLAVTLATWVGEPTGTLILGTPNASDLHVTGLPESVFGTRWHWHNGGWRMSNQAVEPWRYQQQAPWLYLDAWPGYERSPQDNRGSGN